MNKLIAVVGMTGSGKSVITDYLEKNGFKKVYFGGLTYEKMKEEGIPYTPEADKMMRVKMREEYGMAAYAILSLPKIKEYIKDSDVVIDGLYSWDEYLVLKNEFPNIILLSVVVDKNIRYPFTNKELASREHIDNMTKRLLTMFTYTGLPETLPQDEIEEMILDGYIYVTKIEDDEILNFPDTPQLKGGIYAFAGVEGVYPDFYGRATVINIAHPRLKGHIRRF